MKKAVCYLRVSGAGQVDGLGFTRQRERCGKYAERYGYFIVKDYREEGISGTSDETMRPALQSMLEDLLSNGIRDVIIEGLDRLAREYRMQETLLIYLAAKGIQLHSARTEENVTESMEADPMRKALVQIQGIFAELEKNLLVKKLANARQKIREKQGKCEGAKAYGEISAEEAAVVERILAWRDQGLSLRAVAKKLNGEGIPTRYGGTWHAKQIQRIARRAQLERDKS